LKRCYKGNTLWTAIITEDDMSTTVTTKGQVTIPKPVRDFLGIVPGSRVDFQRAADGSVVITRADRKQPESRFGKLRGHAGDGLDTDAIMALTRGDK
jgi:antitoxin PrlF